MTKRPSSNSLTARLAAVALALLLALPAAVDTAQARAGGGFSFGSRGTRTFSMPPSTATAPRPAAPMQWSDQPRMGAPAPGGFGQPRRFGFGSGLAAGLLGAGLFGMLTGHGFFGGIGGLLSLFGLLFQLALIAGIAWLALAFFRGRSPAAFAGRPGPSVRTGFAGGGSGGFGGTSPLTLAQGDFAAFERTLSDVQYAYSREDMGALSRFTTPEMLRSFGEQVEDNRRRGLRNDMADVRLIQGDLAEAWREGATDYATVAMRFAARDVMLDRSTGRLASGDPDRPVEATELWTFRRDRGGPWVVSAIQQTN